MAQIQPGNLLLKWLESVQYIETIDKGRRRGLTIVDPQARNHELVITKRRGRKTIANIFKTSSVITVRYKINKESLPRQVIYPAEVPIQLPRTTATC